MEYLSDILSVIAIGYICYWLVNSHRKNKAAKKKDVRLYSPMINHLGELSMSMEDYTHMMVSTSLEEMNAKYTGLLTYKKLRPSFRRFLSPRYFRLDKLQRYAVNSFVKNGMKDTELVLEMRRAVTASAIYWGRYIPKPLFLPDAGSYKYFLLLLNTTTEAVVPSLDEVQRQDNETDRSLTEHEVVLIGMMADFMSREIYDLVRSLPHYYYRHIDNYNWPLLDVMTKIAAGVAEFKYNPFATSPTTHQAFVELMKGEKVVSTLVTVCAAIYGFKIPKDYVHYSTLGRNLLLHFKGQLKIVPSTPPEPPKTSHLKVIK